MEKPINTSALFYSHWSSDIIAGVLAIGGPVGVGTQVGTAVIGQRQHVTTQNGRTLRDGTFAYPRKCVPIKTN